MSQLKITGPLFPIKGNVSLPISKSIANRILIIQSLIGKPLAFADQQLPEDVKIMQSLLKSGGSELNVQHAGTAYRFLLAYLSIQNGTFILDGSARMRKRPIGILVQSLQSLGADIQYLEKEGFPPLKISGKKLHSKGKPITLRADVSSQYISALMMIAPYIEGGLELRLEGKVLSAPYIQMTANLMQEAGVDVFFDREKISIPQKAYSRKITSVERDWSAAPYFLSILLLQKGNELFFPELHLKSSQGDAIASQWFKNLGLESYQEKSGTRFIYKQKEKPFVFEKNFSDQPDLVPTFAMLCLASGIKARLSGCDNLNLKESNRLDLLKESARKLGAIIYEPNSATELFFDPPENISIPEDFVFPTLDDHRLAMSYSLMGSLGRSIKIADPSVVGKSFPAFWNELKNLGFDIEENQ